MTIPYSSNLVNNYTGFVYSQKGRITSAKVKSGIKTEVSAVAQSKLNDCDKMLDKSRIWTGLPYVALTILGAVLLVTTPVGWIAAAVVAIASLAIGGLAILAYLGVLLVNKKERQEFFSELGDIKRFFTPCCSKKPKLEEPIIKNEEPIINNAMFITENISWTLIEHPTITLQQRANIEASNREYAIKRKEDQDIKREILKY